MSTGFVLSVPEQTFCMNLHTFPFSILTVMSHHFLTLIETKRQRLCCLLLAVRQHIFICCLEHFWPAYYDADGFTSVAQSAASWSSHRHAPPRPPLTLSTMLKMASERLIAGHRGVGVHSCLQRRGEIETPHLNWANVTFCGTRWGMRRISGNFWLIFEDMRSRGRLQGLLLFLKDKIKYARGRT